MDLIKKKEQELLELKQMFEKEQHELALNHAFDLELGYFNSHTVKSLEVITDNDFTASEIFIEKTLFKLIFNDSSLIYSTYNFRSNRNQIFASNSVHSSRFPLYNVGEMFNIWHNNNNTGFNDPEYNLMYFLNEKLLIFNAVDYANFLKNLELFILKYLSVKKSFPLSLFSKCFNSF